MRSEIKNAIEQMSNKEEVDYMSISSAWEKVFKIASEEHGSIDNLDHVMAYADRLRRAGFSVAQIESLIKIFIESQNIK